MGRADSETSPHEISNRSSREETECRWESLYGPAKRKISPHRKTDPRWSAVTVLGYLVLPVGLAGLFLSKKWLYRLFVFSTLFSASSVANFGEGEKGSALQVWMVFGSLWLLRIIFDHISTLSFSIERRLLRPFLWMAAFLLVAALSLVMPLYIDGKLSIASQYLFDETVTPLFLTWHNVTQLLYLVLGIAITISVAQSNLRSDDRHKTERVILLSAIFVSVWGLFQLVCNITGIPYPGYIFNNSGSASGKGFLEYLQGVGVGRICSAAVEPSVLAQSLLSLLPLTLAAWLNRDSVISVFIDRLCAVLFIVLVILTTSSTGYLGLLMLAALVVILLLRTGKISLGNAVKLAAATTFVVAVVAFSYFSIPIVRDVVGTVLIDKASSGSGLERALTIVQAFRYFQEFPVLGIGWGSATSHDLIVKLLSNVGIIGAFTFLGAMYCVMRANWRALDTLVPPRNLWRATWLLSLAIFLLTSVINEFPLPFGNFWLVLGMAMSTGWKTEPACGRACAPASA